MDVVAKNVIKASNRDSRSSQMAMTATANMIPEKFVRTQSIQKVNSLLSSKHIEQLANEPHNKESAHDSASYNSKM